ncbi:MAG: beta-propeller domain-containing protein [Clostridiaceae bacterium]
MKDMDKLKKEFDEIEVPVEIDLAVEKGIRKAKRRKCSNRFSKYSGMAAAILVLIFSFSFKLGGGTVKENNENSGVKLVALPTIKSYENLLAILDENQKNRNLLYGTVTEKSTSGITNGMFMDGGAGENYSQTNNQVANVEEEDSVKSDGEFIYKIRENNNQVSTVDIIKAYKPEGLSLTNTIELEGDFHPNGIYLKGKYLVVIGNKYSYKGTYAEKVCAIVYDVEDKLNIKKLRQIETEGNYISSRMIKSNIYIISNKYLDYDTIKNGIERGCPIINDDAVKDPIVIPYGDINYLSESEAPNYINITSLDLDNIDNASNTKTILGSGDNIYVSENNIYVAGTKINDDKDMNTVVYKFNLNNGEVSFLNQAEIPGRVLDQFSMDEYKEYFRIATTTDKMMFYFMERSDIALPNDTNSDDAIVDEPSKNNIYVLDEDMNIKGSLEGLAEGEKIYSASFMGDKAYLVTYKEMDPFFVIDMKNPEQPKVLGELKIPGFSNYLYPYDENHIIGFGQETGLVNEGGEERAKPEGMKIALFDVTDVSNPKEIDKVVIGEAGTTSSVLYDHKALMHYKEKNIFAIPIDIYGDNNYETFQGAYIFSLDLKNGFKTLGKLTNIENGFFEKYNSEYFTENYEIYQDSVINKIVYYQDSVINRIVYIDNNIYTISNKYIKSYDIDSLEEIKALNLY